MTKRISTIILTIIAIFGFSTLALSQISRSTKDDLYSQIELFSYVLTTVQSDYVDEKTPKDLIYGSLKGMLDELDPHSQFLTPEDYAELKEETEGKFGGLGIEISIRDGVLTVITPIEDTPAWDIGLKAGDLIVKIEDELTKGMTLNQAVKRLRGDPGTDVNITVLREETYEILEFKITRQIIHVQDVKHVQILKDNIGYIRLTEFREDSAHEFRKGLDQLAKDGAESLIVDLRNNPGGLLNVAIDITEEFLSEGQTIVSTKGRRFSQNTVTISQNTDHLIDWPVVVLINKGSASGSEIFAGALKDNKRAVTLGTTSFGKGSVQSVIPMPDGSGLRLTTSKYFTPSGESIHEKGITPDIIVEYIPPAKKEEDKEEIKDTQKIEKVFENIEGKEFKDPEAKEDNENSAKNETKKLTKLEQEVRDRLLSDNQVVSAMNVLKGIKIYKNIYATQTTVTPTKEKDQEQTVTTDVVE